LGLKTSLIDANTDLDQVVGALKYQVMHYYDTDDDIVNAATTVVKDVSDWESWTPTDPLQAFLKMGVDVFEMENTVQKGHALLGECA
jgi:hypothetical protein